MGLPPGASPAMAGDSAPIELAPEADIEILTHELFVASRRVFGDIFPRVPGEYSKSLSIVEEEDQDELDGAEELEIKVETKPKKNGMKIVRYNLAVVSFSPCSYDGYKSAIAQEFGIDPNNLNTTSNIVPYFYSEDDTVDRATISPPDDLPRTAFPDRDFARRPPQFSRYTKAAEQV